MKGQSPIFSRTYDLLRWIVPVTVKFPRQQRFVMAEVVQRSAFELLERLIEASKSSQPMEELNAADASLTKLRYYLRLCHALELLQPGQYAHVAAMVDEIGRLLGGWIKSNKKE